MFWKQWSPWKIEKSVKKSKKSKIKKTVRKQYIFLAPIKIWSPWDDFEGMKKNTQIVWHFWTPLNTFEHIPSIMHENQ